MVFQESMLVNFQAYCEFRGAGTREVMGLLLLSEYETLAGTEIE